MNDSTETRTVLRGLPLSNGIALARICLFNEIRHTNLPTYHISEEDIDREQARLKHAISIVDRRLEDMHDSVSKRIGQAEAEIFTAQKMILDDELLQQDMMQLIATEKQNAEIAVSRVLDKYENRLREIDNEYINERASDIGEIRRRVLDILQNMHPSLMCADEQHCQRGRNRIIVAEELTPSLTTHIDTAEAIGFVTEQGGKNSHAAILARALGIPAVSGIEAIYSNVSCGTEILVDGTTGEVVIWPNDADRARAAAHQTTTTGDVWSAPIQQFCIQANISLAGDVQEACAVGAEGIGLYRTEFEFMAAEHQLNEKEQTERYCQVVKAMDNYPATFRLLDMGGDKPFSFLELPPEINPAMGWRGSRLLLSYPDILRTQARALAASSRISPIRVLYPMIVDVNQFRKLRSIFMEAVQDLNPGSIQHGVMLEVPSACLAAEELLQEADFASIGSNDLIQYLFAVDRDNNKVADDYNADHPVFWALLQQMAQAATKTGKQLSICGELAGDTALIHKIYETGIRSASISPRLIPAARHAIAKHIHEG